jgi:hypothetical protein
VVEWNSEENHQTTRFGGIVGWIGPAFCARPVLSGCAHFTIGRHRLQQPFFYELFSRVFGAGVAKGKFHILNNAG